MRDLSKDIEYAITNCIEVLNFDVDVVSVKSEKLSAIMSSKIETFASTKQLLMSWQQSMNAPSEDKLIKYVNQLIKAGDNSINTLRQALRKNIDPNEVDPEKHGASAKAKPLIFNAISEINRGVIELQLQIDAGKIDLLQRDFRRGAPERFSSQEFYPEKDYHKDWFDEENGAILICPKSTRGEIIVLDGLKIILPAIPKNKKDILFSKLPKEEQFWRRTELPKGLTPDNEDVYTEYILEEFAADEREFIL